MEAHTPNLAERFILLKGELRLRLDARTARHGIAGVLDVLIGALLMRVIGLFARLAERRSRQQACRDSGGVELKRLGAPGSFAAARSLLVCDGVTDEGCIRDEGERAACGQPPCGRLNLVAHLAAIERTVSSLEYGHRAFEGRFAKIGLRGWVELRRIRYDIEMFVGCCPE